MSDDDIYHTFKKRFRFLRRKRHVKKESKETGTSLKQYVEVLESEKAALLEERDRLQRKLTEAVSSHPYNVRNLQIGDNCTMVPGSDMGSLGETIEEVEGLIDKLTDALERDVNERARLATDNESTKMQLNELKDLITEQSRALWTLAKHGTLQMDDLKTFLSNLEADRSDEDLIGDSLTALKKHVTNNTVTGFTSLPMKAKPGIIRIVNKFGTVPWKSFALQIGLNQQSMNACLKYSGDASLNEDLPESDNLDKDMCAVILKEWVEQCGDAIDEFMQGVEEIQLDLHGERIDTYLTEVIGYGRHQYQEYREYHTPVKRTVSTESIVTRVTTRTECRSTQRADPSYVEEQLKKLTEMMKYVIECVPHTTTQLTDLHAKLDAITDHQGFYLRRKNGWGHDESGVWYP